MKLAIVSSGKGWQSEELKNAALERGWQVEFLSPRAFSIALPDFEIRNADLNVLDYDAFLIRSIPHGSLEQIVFRLDSLYLLEMLNKPVVNPPFVVEKTVDKLYTSMLLSRNGIPTPKTVVVERFSDAMFYFKALGGDVVVKPLFGSNGLGLIRVDNEDLAHRIFRVLELGRYVFYLQEFIPHNNEDIRVFVAGDSIVSAMLRKGTSWKTNICQGASPLPFDPPGEMREICHFVLKLLGADYLGIDLVFSEDGELYVIEVNGIPGWRGLQSVTKTRIADAILDCVARKLSL
ncbi:MAG: RimK family alpha-L-glutamate ligase [Synergistetes bacterium]|nr:MAG: Orf5 [bacterium 42_11]MBC7332264.1 RimK family alpha-L-glutamate ligase [Synergistota bacterium]MDK2870962.1 hypothetical protein [bacterium]